MPSPASRTRSGQSGSQNINLINEFRTIVKELETNINAKLDMIINRVETIESKFESVQANQVAIEIQLKEVKNIIISQQQYIEKQEILKRSCNLIMSNVPEADVETENAVLTNDEEKIQEICEVINPEFVNSELLSVTRLGQAKKNIVRPIKVVFNNVKCRDFILYKQKTLRENEDYPEFARTYINKDLPILTRNEEKRLRNKARDIRTNSKSDDRIYIKHGKLIKNKDVIDQFNLGNQLF